jgi:FixJ family two-component response regulator
MHREDLTVYIIDDDPSVRDALALMLGIAGYRTALFSDAESFLGTIDESCTGCILADLKLPGQSGLELQACLKARSLRIPVIIITAQGDIASARTAFRADAVDFLLKPFESSQLLGAVQAALERESQRLAGDKERQDYDAKLETLTSREREVLDRVAEGMHAKEIALALGISSRTVEVHKASIMEKVGARNVAGLVRFALTAVARRPDGERP